MALSPLYEEPQVVFVTRRRWSCTPSCGCCLLGVMVLLFGFVVLAALVLAALDVA